MINTFILSHQYLTGNAAVIVKKQPRKRAIKMGKTLSYPGLYT